MLMCKKGFQVQVLSSGAGYYIGTIDDWEPNCRVSGHYGKKEHAAKAMENRNFFRDCVENSFCNGGAGCGIKEVQYSADNSYTQCEECDPEDCKICNECICILSEKAQKPFTFCTEANNLCCSNCVRIPPNAAVEGESQDFPF